VPVTPFNEVVGNVKLCPAQIGGIALKVGTNVFVIVKL
jgi:hypothetical protein